MPGFLKLPVFFFIGDDKWELSTIRVNPNQVVCYYPIHRTINSKEEKTTSLIVGGSTYVIAMSFDEFDVFWETEVKRGFEVK